MSDEVDANLERLRNLRAAEQRPPLCNTFGAFTAGWLAADPNRRMDRGEECGKAYAAWAAEQRTPDERGGSMRKLLHSLVRKWQRERRVAMVQGRNGRQFAYGLEHCIEDVKATEEWQNENNLYLPNERALDQRLDRKSRAPRET